MLIIRKRIDTLRIVRYTDVELTNRKVLTRNANCNLTKREVENLTKRKAEVEKCLRGSDKNGLV